MPNQPAQSGAPSPAPSANFEREQPTDVAADPSSADSYPPRRPEAVVVVASNAAEPRTATRHSGSPWLRTCVFIFGVLYGQAFAVPAFILVMHTAFVFCQIIIVTAMLAFSASHESPTRPGLTEWEACGKNGLGIWLIVWILRLALLPLFFDWRWWLNKRRGQFTNPKDASAGLNMSQTSQLCWLILAQTELYNGQKPVSDSCQYAGPHIWWTAFAISCLSYVLYIPVVALITFAVTKHIFLAVRDLNLRIRGLPVPARQTLMGYTTAISKMPQTTVDHIPLVYGIIPPESMDVSGSIPPNSEGGDNNQQGCKSPAELEEGRAYNLDVPHLPEHPIPPSSTSNANINLIRRIPRRLPIFLRLFRILARRLRKRKEEGKKNVIPTIHLRESQRTCAICFEDFVSLDASSSLPANDSVTSASATVGQLPELLNQPNGNATGAPEPLRLLECQHVFHMSCVDPWLTTVSARCPTCQQAISVQYLTGTGRRPDVSNAV